MKLYWTFRDEVAVFDGVVMKGEWFIIPAKLQMETLEQLYNTYMGMKKVRLWFREFVSCG